MRYEILNSAGRVVGLAITQETLFERSPSCPTGPEWRIVGYHVQDAQGQRVGYAQTYSAALALVGGDHSR